MGSGSMGAVGMGLQLSGHGIGAPGMTDMAGHQSPMGGAAAVAGYGPSAGLHGGGHLGAVLPGGDLFSDSEFELNGDQRGGVVSPVEPEFPVVLQRPWTTRCC